MTLAGDEGRTSAWRALSIPGLPPLLSGFAAASAILTLIAVAAHLVCVYALHRTGYPYQFYMLPSFGDDLGLFHLRFQHLHSVSFFDPRWGTPWTYPAPVAPFYAAFYLIRHPGPEFIALSAILVCTLAALLARRLREHGIETRPALLFVTLATVCSYPMLFELSRGNMELFVWLFAGLGVYLVLSGRGWAGAAMIGVAGSMKLYPIFYLGLLLARRQYRQLLFGCLAAAGITVLCLWFVDPDVHAAWAGTQAGLRYFAAVYSEQYRLGLSGVDHSLFGLIKRCLGPQPLPRYARLLSVYTATAALAGLVCFVIRIRKLPTVNQVVCLTIAAILLPPTSFDYTLIHLYTAWALLVVVAADRWRQSAQPSDRALLLMFCACTVLLSQIGEFVMQGDRIGGQVKAVTLLLLGAVALWCPIASRFDPVETIHAVSTTEGLR